MFLKVLNLGQDVLSLGDGLAVRVGAVLVVVDVHLVLGLAVLISLCSANRAGAWAVAWQYLPNLGTKLGAWVAELGNNVTILSQSFRFIS